MLTLKRVDPDLLSECECVLDLLLFDTLDPQALEGDGHRLWRDLQRADSLLAALLPDQVVRVRAVGSLGAHGRDHDHRTPSVAHNLKQRKKK